MTAVRKSRKRSFLLLVSAAIAIIIGLTAAFSLVGHPARLVSVLTIFFSGVAAGVTLVDAIRSLRDAPADATPPPEEPVETVAE